MTKARALLLAAATALTPVTVKAADDQVTTFSLDNGMQVVVVEDHRAPVVQHMVWYRAGSADEEPGASGAAHFLEHLLFKATDTLESGEFSAVVAANGGNDNAFTSYDYTAYFQRVAADRLELMMQMESDRMRNIRITEQDILTERDVIIEERNQRTENNPRSLFGEQMSAAQYLNHGYGIPIIGWMHEMETLDLGNTMAYYDRFYHPNNAVLVVTGDVTPENVRELAETYYGVIPSDLEKRTYERTQEPPQRAERRVIYRDARVAQPYVQRSYSAPERDPGSQEKAAALTILAEVLGGGTTSYLAEKLQFDTQKAVYAGSFYRGTSRDDTSFDVIVVPSPGVSLEEAETLMDETLAQFIEDGVDEEQLARIKQQLKAAQIYARDNVDSIGNRYGQALSTGLSVQDVQDWPNILQAVTGDDVIEAARAVMDKRASVTGWLMRDEEVTQ